jgi:hypothetical protein
MRQKCFIGVLYFFVLPALAVAITPTQLSLFKRHHCLVLVYSAHCHFCQRFIPVVTAFEQQHHWPGVAFTVDTASPLWPDVERLSRRVQYAWFGGHVQVPALFLYSDVGTISLISLGALTPVELEQRLSIFITHVLTDEKKSI